MRRTANPRPADWPVRFVSRSRVAGRILNETATQPVMFAATVRGTEEGSLRLRWANKDVPPEDVRVPFKA